MNTCTCDTESTHGRTPTCWRLALVTLVGLTGQALVGQENLVTFHRLGDLPDGEVWTVMRGISADGLTVVGESWDAANIQPVRWTLAGGLETLGSLPGGPGGGSAFGVSGDGSVIVGQAGSTLPSGEAFRWTATGGMVGLGAPAGADGAAANGVSQDGATVVGWFSVGFNPFAFRWTATQGFTRINDIAGQDATSTALAIAADGGTTGGYAASPASLPVTQATLWAGSGATGLGALVPGGNSEVRGLSADGSVAVGWTQTNLGLEAFRWTATGGMTSLGMLPNGIPFSFANAVSADGEIVVGRAEGESRTEAFMWTADTGMVAISELLAASGIDLQGWILNEAVGVSADGLVIVGNGENANGDRVAWVADLRDPNETDPEEDDQGGGDDDTGNPPPEQCGKDKVFKHRHAWRGHHGHRPARPTPANWRARCEGFKKLVACVDAKRRRVAPVPVRRPGRSRER